MEASTCGKRDDGGAHVSHTGRQAQVYGWGADTMQRYERQIKETKVIAANETGYRNGPESNELALRSRRKLEKCDTVFEFRE